MLRNMMVNWWIMMLNSAYWGETIDGSMLCWVFPRQWSIDWNFSCLGKICERIESFAAVIGQYTSTWLTWHPKFEVLITIIMNHYSNHWYPSLSPVWICLYESSLAMVPVEQKPVISQPCSGEGSQTQSQVRVGRGEEGWLLHRWRLLWPEIC